MGMPSITLDKRANFVKSQVSNGYSSTAEEIVVADISRFPDPGATGYNATYWDSTNYPDPSDDPNREVVRVTGKDSGTSTLTIVRAQEGTSASNKNTDGVVYMLIVALTAKMIDDIETAINNLDTDDIPEGATNLYYTSARAIADARTAISGGTGISYNSSTGVLTADLSTGVSGGQTLYGGTDSGDDLIISSTTNATKGNIYFGASSVYDEVNIRLGLGITSPSTDIHIEGTTPTIYMRTTDGQNVRDGIRVSGPDSTAGGLFIGGITGLTSFNSIFIGRPDGTAIRVDENFNRISMGVGTTSVSAKVAIQDTSLDQLHVRYSSSSYFAIAVGSTGISNFTATGSAGSFVFNNPTTIYGVGITTFDTTDATISPLIIRTSSNDSNSGGMLLFGSLNGIAGAGIKYIHGSGAGNTTGGLIIGTRNATSDTTLTTRISIAQAGTVTVTGDFTVLGQSTRFSRLTLYSVTDTYGEYLEGAYVASGVYKRLNSLPATNISSQNGDIAFKTAVTGTANSNITWDDRMIVKNTTGYVGIGSTSPQAFLHVEGTTEQLRVGYDNATNYMALTVGSTGVATFDANGSSASFIFNDSVAIGSGASAPTAVLDVQGSLGNPAFFVRGASVNSIQWFYSVSGTPTFTFADSGKSSVIHIDNQIDSAWRNMTLTGRTAQTANILHLEDVSSTELFSVDPSGNTYVAGKLGVGASPSASIRTQLVDISVAQLLVGYDNTTNYMSVLVGSTGAVTFDANGSGAGFRFEDSVGINGSPDASAKLNVIGDAKIRGISYYGSSIHGYLTSNATRTGQYMWDGAGYVERISILANGYVGINNTNPNTQFTVNATSLVYGGGANTGQIAVIGGSSATALSTIRFTNDSSAVERIFGLVNIGGNSADLIAQGYDRANATYREMFRVTENRGKLGLGTGATVSAKLHLIDDTIEQFRVGYDAGTNFLSLTVGSTGIVSLDANGSSASFAFNAPINTQGQIFNVTTVSASTYTVLETDQIIHITRTSTGTCLVTIPSALIASADGMVFEIKDAGNNAGANNITVETEGGEEIEFSTSDWLINGDGDWVKFYIEDGAVFIRG